jgi:MerR family mercuric resistance operon transcriptional regulator
MTFTTGKLARAAHVGIETIRFYERRGLVEPTTRLASGYRVYSEEALTRIQFIRRAQQLGFTLQEIGELIELDTNVTRTCGEVRERTLDKIAALERKIAVLQGMKTELETLANICDGDRLMKDCLVRECLTGACEPA